MVFYQADVSSCFHSSIYVNYLE